MLKIPYSGGMTIELSNEQEALIQEYLATGRFSDQSEVINEAFKLLARKGKNTKNTDRVLGVGNWHGKIEIKEDFDELTEEAKRAKHIALWEALAEPIEDEAAQAEFLDAVKRRPFFSKDNFSVQPD